MTPFNGGGLLRVKDLTEDSEEVGKRKLRPKQWMLAKANHADARRLGKIVTEDFAGCLNVTVCAVQGAQAERLLVLGFHLHGNDRVEVECVVAAKVLSRLPHGIAEDHDRRCLSASR